MKKKKIKWKYLITILISIVCIIISVIYIIKWNNDNHKTKKLIDKIDKITNIKEVDDNQDDTNIEIINQEEEIPEFNPYWDYIKMNLIDVDFNNLYEINDDVKGWIQVNGTNINYPFVQSSDNSYYLNHSFDKSYNSAGWVFLDYRNNFDNLDKNTIIYAHSRLDNTMFGSLKQILRNGWLNNTDNYVIKISSMNHNTLWQVFSVYHIPTTNDYIQVDFKDDDEFLKFTNTLIKRSIFNFNTTVSSDDHILTLSTCYSNDEKVVLHAKLIKKETR